MSTRLQRGKQFLAALGCATACSVQAASVTLPGELFDVIYDKATLGPLGAPTLSGSQIGFSPSGYEARSADGQGEVLTPAVATLTLLPHAGVQLAGLAFTEQGSYRVDGRQSDVNVLGELAVAFAAPGVPTASAAITPAGYFFPNTGATESWSAAAAVDFTAASAAQQAAGLTLTLDQTLQAYTRATDTGVRLAFIATSGALSMQVSVVPEAGSALLLALGLVAIGVVARKSRRSGQAR
jgi:uncharacterized protein YfiM (DUF2279 family)